MPANPLNSSFCVGGGLNVDTLGRPTWKRELAGYWSSAETALEGISGTGTRLLSNIVARVQNTASYPRELVIRAQSNGGWVLDAGFAGPQIDWYYSVGPTVTAGTLLVGSMVQHILGLSCGHRTPCCFGGPTFVTVPAGGTMNCAFTSYTRATWAGAGFVYTYNASAGGTLIEAHWLGA